MRKLLFFVSLIAFLGPIRSSASTENVAYVMNATNSIYMGPSPDNGKCSSQGNPGYSIQALDYDKGKYKDYGQAIGVGAPGPAPIYVQGGIGFIAITRKDGKAGLASVQGAQTGRKYYAVTVMPMENFLQLAIANHNPCG